MSIECKHGYLARVCDRCEMEEEIERLRAFVRAWDALEEARCNFARRDRLRPTAQVNAEFERAAIALERARGGGAYTADCTTPYAENVSPDAVSVLTPSAPFFLSVMPVYGLVALSSTVEPTGTV